MDYKAIKSLLRYRTKLIYPCNFRSFVDVDYGEYSFRLIIEPLNKLTELQEAELIDQLERLVKYKIKK